MSESIVILGAGGHARAVIDVLESEGRFTIAGVVAPQQPMGDEVLGYEWLGTDDSLNSLIALHRNVVIGVGQIPRPDLRIKLFQMALALGAELPIIVSPHSVLSRHARLGRGTIIMHGAVINAGAVVGENCIINTMALVEHDAQIGHNTHVATGARINGECVIGEESFVGSGAVVLQSVVLPSRSVAPAGDVVRASRDLMGEAG